MDALVGFSFQPALFDVFGALLLRDMNQVRNQSSAHCVHEKNATSEPNLFQALASPYALSSYSTIVECF